MRTEQVRALVADLKAAPDKLSRVDILFCALLSGDRTPCQKKMYFPAFDRNVRSFMKHGGRTLGKLMYLNCFLESLKRKLSPTECKFVVIEPKGIDYNRWDGDKHLLCPIVRLDMDVSIQKLQDILHIMDGRYQKLHVAKVKNIDEYRKETNKKRHALYRYGN